MDRTQKVLLGRLNHYAIDPLASVVLITTKHRSFVFPLSSPKHGILLSAASNGMAALSTLEVAILLFPVILQRHESGDAADTNNFSYFSCGDHLCNQIMQSPTSRLFTLQLPWDSNRFARQVTIT